jgi:hypothetical protein
MTTIVIVILIILLIGAAPAGRTAVAGAISRAARSASFS